ncbi:MAG: hypothetical protein WAU33_20320 [Candidatus Binataceae bacterium]
MRIGAGQLFARIVLCVAVIGVCPACSVASRAQLACNPSTCGLIGPVACSKCGELQTQLALSTQQQPSSAGFDLQSQEFQAQAARDQQELEAELAIRRSACKKSGAPHSDDCIKYLADTVIERNCTPLVDPTASDEPFQNCSDRVQQAAELIIACANQDDQAACIDLQNRIATKKRQEQEVQAVAQAQVQEQAVAALQAQAQAQREQARALCYQQMTAPDSFQIESMGTGFQVTPYNRNAVAPLSAYWACQ